MAKINNLRKRICFQKHFLIIVTHLAKNFQPFWGIFLAWQPKVHSTCPMELLNFWKIDFFWKSLFFTPFVDLKRKKLGFLWTFSGVGSTFAIIVAEKTIWVKKLNFPKLLFAKFHTMNFFGTTYVIFVVFWDIEVKTFGLLAKIKDRGFQNCTKQVRKILSKEIFSRNIFFQFQ